MNYSRNNNQGLSLQPAPSNTVAAAMPTTIPPKGGVLTAFSDLGQMLDVANVLANSPLVPAHFKNNQGSVLIALNMAQRLALDPFMVMQNIYVVKGNPGMSGQFAIALLQNSARYRRIEFVYVNGKDYRGGMFVRGYRSDDPKGKAYDEGTAITLELARSEGWMSNSKWSSMPEQMMRYRAASWFARVFVPDELMGLKTNDELEDMEHEKSMRNVSPGKPEAAVTEGLKPAIIAAAPAALEVAEPERESKEEPTPLESVATEELAEDTPLGDGARFLAMLKEAGVSNGDFKKWCVACGVQLPPSAGGVKLDKWATWFFKQDALMGSLYDNYGCVIPMV